MERRAFLRLLGIGLAAGPEAIAEAMKPRIFYSIPAVLPVGTGYLEQLRAAHLAAYDHVLRTAYAGQIHELVHRPARYIDRWMRVTA